MIPVFEANPVINTADGFTFLRSTTLMYNFDPKSSFLFVLVFLSASVRFFGELADSDLGYNVVLGIGYRDRGFVFGYSRRFGIAGLRKAHF